MKRQSIGAIACILGMALLVGTTVWAGGNGFGPGFLWGSLISAHANEGNHANDWTMWEQMPGKISDGSVSGQACNHWQLYPEDIDWAKKLHLNALIISLEWSRIEPMQGQFDEASLAHYAEVLGAARKAGLRPMVVLFDHTLPQWVAAKGGLMVPATILDFDKYAEVVAKRLGDKVDEWLPLREPVSYATRAFKDARCPPGMCDVTPYGKAVAVLMGMQRGAYDMLKRHDLADADNDGVNCAVGLLHGMTWVRPARIDNPTDVALARAQDGLMNWTFLDGVLPRALPAGQSGSSGKGEAFGKSDTFGKGGSVPGGAPINAGGPLFPKAADFLIVNYRGLAEIKFNLLKPLFVERVVPQGMAADDLGQVIDPADLAKLLVSLKSVQVPVYAMVGVDDRAGTRREAFILEHVRHAVAAVAQGVDLRGFFVEPLLSGFEYEHGFAPKRGLLTVNTAVQERKLAPGADMLGKCAAANGLP